MVLGKYFQMKKEIKKNKTKLLSKRQLNRRIALATKSTLSEIKNAINEQSSLNFIVKDVVTSLSIDKTDLRFTFNDSNNVNLDINEKVLFDNDGSVSDSSDVNDFSLDRFRELVIRNNLTSHVVDELLKLLKPHFNFLPKTSRTLLHTARSNTFINLNNGQMCYFGFQSFIELKLDQGFKIDSVLGLNFQVNIDGLPLFKSSSLEFYPILARDSNFAGGRPFVVGIFCGIGKPDPLSLFLEKFITEVNYLKDNNLIYKNISHKFSIKFFICDAPARAYLKQIVGHNSLHGCEKCAIIGERVNHRTVFNSTVLYQLRKDDDFYTSQSNSHIKGPSPLCKLNVNFITQFPLDPMHLIFLGVMKRLLFMWVEGKRPFKFSNCMIKEINRKTNILKKYVSSDFVRKPRTLKDLKRWKATEFRLFLLYTGPILLKDVLNADLYSHFMLFHVAITIFSNSAYTKKYCNIAQDLLAKFVKESVRLYGPEFNVYNVHSLVHISSDVLLYGPIDEYSCFSFENYLGKLKTRLRSKNNPLQQICNRLQEYENSCEYDITHNSVLYKPLRVFNKNAVGHFYCKKLVTKNYMLSIFFPDNCVLTFKGVVGLVKKIIFVNSYKLFLVPFLHKYNLYTDPINSSSLNVFYVKTLCRSKGQLYNIEEVFLKCNIYPYKEGYTVFPLLHLSN